MASIAAPNTQTKTSVLIATAEPRNVISARPFPCTRCRRRRAGHIAERNQPHALAELPDQDGIFAIQRESVKTRRRSCCSSALAFDHVFTTAARRIPSALRRIIHEEFCNRGIDVCLGLLRRRVLVDGAFGDTTPDRFALGSIDEVDDESADPYFAHVDIVAAVVAATVIAIT